MGHGAATEGSIGYVHLAGDIAHALAAGGWIGALVLFCIALIRPAPSMPAQKALVASLASFSGAGTAFVGIIIVSGLINSAFLVGWNPERIISAPYGQVLIVKLILFLAMLALAAGNRFQHAPTLTQALLNAEQTTMALSHLRKSVTAETVTAASVLVLVSWLGTLAPVTAQ